VAFPISPVYSGKKTMNQNEALNILIRAAELANKRGTYSLKESQQIAAAVDAFQEQQEPQPEPEKEKE
jgi:hypothetical protein